MSTSDAEREILARVRGASSSASAQQVRLALQALGTKTENARDRGAELDDYLAKLTGNGISASAVATRGEAVMEIATVVRKTQTQRKVVVGADPRLAALPWRDGGLLPRFGVAGRDDRTSVSYAQAGIAESGSVVLWLDKRNPAPNNLLVEQHIVLLDERDLRPTLEAVWEPEVLYDADRRPRGIMLISGPSSTADIAMQHVRGAHGPRGLHVIVLRG